MSDSTLSTLDNIRIKTRRLVRCPSVNQLSDADLDSYINTFVLYDFPAHLRLSSLKENLTFFTMPGVDAYATTTVPITDPLYNFKNKFMNIEPPVYISGYQAFFTQSQEQFYAIYPKVNSQMTVDTGDGITATFTGVLPSLTPLLRNNLMFTAKDIAGDSMVLVDDGLGHIVEPNGVPTLPLSTFNYTTNAYNISFPFSPGAGQNIILQSVPVVLNRPQAIMYFDDTFYVRPVPDMAYRIDLQVNVRPTELLNATQQPELAQWWQYIAYGASKKIFEDRNDMDSVQQIMPEFKNQETLIQRKTIAQQGTERTATIYTENVGSGYGAGWGGSGWGPW
jgi:hypothetical protein